MLAKVLYKIAFMLLLMLPAHLYAQVIKGRVTDDLTGKPLENVNVYLNGTYQGTTTDSQGNFILNNTLQARGAIIVSYVGYQEQKINNYTNEALKIALKRKVTALNEVVIEPDDFISRARAMRIFLEEFIGYADCEINNPDDIYFHYNKKKDRLIAGADKPLLIKNKKLGYTITYFLNDFRRSPTQTVYKGNYFFSEDTSRLSAKKVKQIMQARDKAYYGSRMHFIRALWANELEKNNFSIYAKLKGAINYDHTYTSSELNALSYSQLIENIEGKKFVFIGKANVDETKFDKNGIYIVYSTDARVFHSFMRQKNGMDGVIINSSGDHDEGLQWDGTIGIARVGELLPFEFQPAE